MYIVASQASNRPAPHGKNTINILTPRFFRVREQAFSSEIIHHFPVLQESSVVPEESVFRPSSPINPILLKILGFICFAYRLGI